MEQCVDSEEVTAKEIYLRRINWNVILPNVLSDFKDLVKEAHNQSSTIEHHIKLYKADRCAELCAINTAAVDMAHNKDDETQLDAEPVNASLTFSQDDQGYVAIVMHARLAGDPQDQQDDQEQIVLGVYDSPTQVSKSVIKTALEDFGAYVRVLNSANKCRYRDRKRINNLASLSKSYTERSQAPSAPTSNWVWAFAFIGLLGIGVMAMMRKGYIPPYFPM